MQSQHRGRPDSKRFRNRIEKCSIVGPKTHETKFIASLYEVSGKSGLSVYVSYRRNYRTFSDNVWLYAPYLLTYVRS
jgi:hypothetical protein